MTPVVALRSSAAAPTCSSGHPVDVDTLDSDAAYTSSGTFMARPGRRTDRGQALLFGNVRQLPSDRYAGPLHRAGWRDVHRAHQQTAARSPSTARSTPTPASPASTATSRPASGPPPTRGGRPPVMLGRLRGDVAQGRDLSPSPAVLLPTCSPTSCPPSGHGADRDPPAIVREWHVRLKSQDRADDARPRLLLLRTIMNTARRRRRDTRQSVPGPRRGQRSAARQIREASLAELEAIAPGHARPVPADGAARRVVRAAVRRADRTAPRRHRRKTAVVRVRRGVVRR